MPRKDRDPLHPPKILIVLHQETSTPGRVGQMLTRRGYILDIRRPRLGDDLPDTLSDHEGAIMFGGPMSCNDDEDYIRREIDWLAVPLREAKPYLGICLGAQMLARQLGASVGPHAHGRVEIGYYPIRPTEPGKALMKWPAEVYHWHREGFDLPSGATLLAEGDDFPNQAYRYGPAAYGIQFHPELTLAMMYRWTTFGAPRFELPGAQGRDHHFDGRARADAAVRLWLDRFIDLWLDPSRAVSCEAANDDRSVAIVAAE